MLPQQGIRRGFFLGIALWVAGMLGGGSGAASVSAANPAPAGSALVQHHSARQWVNPHLHLSPTAGHGAIPAHAPKIERHRRHWHPLWDARVYIALHRGLGAVHGVVHTVSGQPAAGARVALRKAKGGIFARAGMKHLTYTSSNGEFAMTNVRPGTYRVRASIDAAHEAGFTPVHVETGVLQNVAVTLDPPAPPKKHGH